jgi:hypothetical protein
MFSRFFDVPICSTNLATGEVPDSRRFAIHGSTAAPDIRVLRPELRFSVASVSSTTMGTNRKPLENIHPFQMKNELK